ncbi:MAG TPA: Ldh family oxidoreductase, partial [Dehalococcoidia bacterium]|nr:Ldh family oxidoreductase [Dehalococcoidia bacterium]
ETEIPDEYNILPLGGTREIGSHKGYGLAVMLEIMTSILSATGGGLRRRNGSTHHFIAYNIDAFSNLKDFTKDLDDYLDDLKQNPPVSGQERVVYAGQLEHETEIEREQNGIPYHPEVIDWFKSITSELKIDW